MPQLGFQHTKGDIWQARAERGSGESQSLAEYVFKRFRIKFHERLSCAPKLQENVGLAAAPQEPYSPLSARSPLTWRRLAGPREHDGLDPFVDKPSACCSDECSKSPSTLILRAALDELMATGLLAAFGSHFVLCRADGPARLARNPIFDWTVRLLAKVRLTIFHSKPDRWKSGRPIFHPVFIFSHLSSLMTQHLATENSIHQRRFLGYKMHKNRFRFWPGPGPAEGDTTLPQQDS